MHAHDSRGELAPRDIVARAIDFEMKKHGLDHVWLDATHLGEAFLKEHFPTIHARCLALGIDIARQPIPVVPAAHYTCGGVVTDLHGRSRRRRACTPWARPPTPGCTAPTGWPATRCSNAWCSAAPAPSTSCNRDAGAAEPVPAWDESQVEDADEQVVIAHNWDELRLLMWNYVGIVRTTKRLERALHRIELLQQRDRRVLRQLPRHARPARAAQPGASAPS